MIVEADTVLLDLNPYDEWMNLQIWWKEYYVVIVRKLERFMMP